MLNPGGGCSPGASPAVGPMLPGALTVGAGGQRLQALGYDADIRAAAEVDRFAIAPELRGEPLRIERGAVGMALSGKDTGGSQWFVTHSPQPHLDGGYTVFGHVIRGMEVVDNIARGDIIRRVIVNER